MTTSHVALLLWAEAAAVAVAFAALGAAPRPGASPRRRLATLGAALAIHAAAAAVAWALAGGPGDAAQLARVRLLFAGEALAAWGLAAAIARARADRGVAAAASALVVVALAVAPAPGEAAARALGDARARTAAFAASPPFAASAALGLDLLHEPALYGRAPAAVMEMHMTSWIWTAGGFALAGSLLALVALARGRRPGRAGRAVAAAAVVALALGGPACKKKEEAAKREPAPVGKVEPHGSAPRAGAPAGPTAAEARAAIDRGIAFLVQGRGDDGLIGGHPGTTALAALAIASGGVAADDPRVAPSLAALARLARPDGAIVDKDYPVYVTAISALAFQAAKVHPELVAKAQRWLADKQFSERHGVAAADPNYGGIGYGADAAHPDADLSNLHFALDALKDSTLADRPEVLARAQAFLARCQNRTESNDQPWAGNDGGFVYKPGASKAGGTASSGSMTYAGVAAFLYAEVPAGDPRVAAALDWLRANYSVDENPGLGAKGLYYHFHMMARALALVGERVIVDSDGQRHDWPAELAAKLVALQRPDGSWANEDPTYWENNPAIATARALIALEHAVAAME